VTDWKTANKGGTFRKSRNVDRHNRALFFLWSANEAYPNKYGRCCILIVTFSLIDMSAADDSHNNPVKLSVKGKLKEARNA
jgi:hypothetical protein